MWRKLSAIAWLSILELFRRRDIYVALILAAAVGAPMLAINVFGVAGTVGYVREVSLLLVWVFSMVIAVTTAARQVPGEVQRRTILPLLAKPLSRGEFVVGKVLGGVGASWAALALFYGFFMVLDGLKSGELGSLVLLQAFLLHGMFCLLLICLTMLGSMVFTPSANLTCSFLVCAGMLLFGARLPGFISGLRGLGRWLAIGLANLVPHFELFDLRRAVVHQWEPLPWSTMAWLCAYAVGYSAVLVAAAIALFKRKHF